MSDINLVPHPLTGTPFGAALDLCLIVAAAVLLADFLFLPPLLMALDRGKKRPRGSGNG